MEHHRPARSMNHKSADTVSRSAQPVRQLSPRPGASPAPFPSDPQQILQLQRTIGNRAVMQLIRSQAGPIQKKENNTGMPDTLKEGVENLSGMDLSDVQVHYGSDKPGRLQALAYAQGNEIHLGPGQERHLPHEAWHIVQQRQGRVAPSFRVGETAINDDPLLEREADEQGRRAMSAPPQSEAAPAAQRQAKRPAGAPVVQASNAVDLVLGTGAYNTLTQAIAANNRNYNDAPFLASRAHDLLDAGMNAQEAIALLTALFAVIDRQSVLGRAVGSAAQMRQNNVPQATILGVLTQHADMALSQANAAGVVHLAGALQAWGFADVDAVLQAYAANANGLTLQQWATVAALFPGNQSADAIAFAQMAGWGAAASRSLAQAFIADANHLTAADWVAIVGDSGNNQHARATAFARTAHWGAAAIRQLVQAFVAGANGLNAAQWVAVAESMANDAHADAVTFARLAGWNPASIVTLAQHFGNNNYGAGAAAWVALAPRRPNDPDYIRRLAHYVGNGWPDRIAFNGGNAELRLVGDGIMYGNGNPHVTIHNLDETVGFNTWRGGGHPEYHVRLNNGSANVYDFAGAQDAFFNNVNMTNAPQARNLAGQFRNAMGI